MFKIDHREHDLIAAINAIKPETLAIEIIALPIGDVILVDPQTGVEKIIIERKTLKDLSSSITDSRYEEQSYRLTGSPVHNHNIMYLIEGDLTKMRAGDEKKRLYSAMFSINYYKGFSLLRSLTVAESAEILCNMAAKYSRESAKKAGFYESLAVSTSTDDVGSSVQQKTQPEYCTVVKKVKKDNINSDNIGIIMLSQIPGVSSVIATAVLQQYGNSLASLVIAIEKDPLCLVGLTMKTEAGKSRRINETAINSILTYLSKC